MPNLNAWPVQADIDLKLAVAGITPRAEVTAAYYTQVVAAVAQQVTQITKRQFVAGSAGEIRYFDGSGTAEQDVDEYVDVTDVQILGYLGAPGTSLSVAYEPVDNLYPKTRIVIFQGSLPAIGRVWLDSFPAGRKNIKVTGTWGYGSTIPYDLWEAVVEEAASRIAAESLFNPSGRLGSWAERDVMEKRDLTLPGEANSWHRHYLAALANYSKPLQTHLRKKSRRMM